MTHCGHMRAASHPLGCDVDSRLAIDGAQEQQLVKPTSSALACVGSPGVPATPGTPNLRHMSAVTFSARCDQASLAQIVIPDSM